MQTVNQTIQELAKKWNMTKHDANENEEWVLTEDEELAAVSYAIEQAKKFFKFKYMRVMPEAAVEFKMKGIDWEIEKINRLQVVETANRAKLHAIWVEEQKVKKAAQEAIALKLLKQEWTARRVFDYMRKVSWVNHQTKLIVNEETTHLIKSICFFISEDPRFETELGFDLKKGLLLRGPSGLGKTFLITCIKDNPVKPITIFSLIKISKAVQKTGDVELPNLEGLIYLDDVGTEETPIVCFGTHVHWFKEYLELYYSQGKPSNRLIVSTNLSFDKIELKYTFRVRSRMKDMFNTIDVRGEDLRGKNKQQ